MKTEERERLMAVLAVLRRYWEALPEDDWFTPLDGCTDADWEALNAFRASYPGTLTAWEDQGERLVRLAPGFRAALAEAVEEEREEAAKADTSPIREMGIDIETYSPEDLGACGVYRYAEAPGFEVLLFAVSVNGGPVAVYDLARGEELPERVVKALEYPAVAKSAYNAAFERVCLGRWLGRRLDPRQWDCTMARGAMAGYPLGLDACGAAMGIERKKMREGKALVRFFCTPCRPTKANGGRTRNRPEDDPEKWEAFKRYCRRDVEAEQEIRRRLLPLAQPETERRLYALDQDINDRGVAVDLTLVEQAMRMDAACKARLSAEAARLGGLENPNSVAQLKAWLEGETGRAVATLSKKDLPDMIARAGDGAVRRMLEIRAEMGKTSTKKYEAIRRAACRDGRVRGLLQFHGTRTGRWAGRLVQVQNLPQNHLEDIATARELAREGDAGTLELLYGSLPETLSQLVRTAFVAPEGRTLLVCDFSAIEARVVAWLAGEEWRLEVFRTHGKIYEASAAMMFHVPVEEITKADPRRQKGKIAELALGYQGGTGALRQMGGERMGLTEEEMASIVGHWREANPSIVRLWSQVERAALMVARGGGSVPLGRLAFSLEGGAMLVRLPSGRRLRYPNPRVEKNRFGRDALTFDGVGQATRQWGRQETYGGKLVENIVQAVARDCLALTMLRLAERGYRIVFHVHDEVIIEAAEGQTLEEVEEVFRTPMPWAPGLPLKGAGYATPYYMKD